MAENLSIQSPDFDRIKDETGAATFDAIRLLWTAMNYEMARRRASVRLAQDTIAPLILSDAPSAQQDNYALGDASILLLTGSSNQTFTGFRAPSTGESRILFIHNVGSATYTIAHASASSDAENRIRTQTLANLSLGTDRSVILQYLNGLWRELKLL